MKTSKNQKVLVAMSGGVDSSVAAALLKKSGYDVTGVFMHFWVEPGSRREGIENKCCFVDAERIARQVASKLDIPFYVFHFEKEFKKAVVDYFLKEYAQGNTPNPCVVCNKEIKFGLLFKKMLALDFDYLATGHYSRLRSAETDRRREILNSKHPAFALRTSADKQIPNYPYKLLKAKDKTKDQSYFLWNLKQKQLPQILFPIGDYTKKQVYELAEKRNLSYRRAESFDICFIAGKNHNEFLKKHLKIRPGSIVDTKGKRVGRHEGLPLYTIGQRKDIKIGGIGPFYVVDKDYKTNTLIVANKRFGPKLYSKFLIAEKINWVSGKEPKMPLKCQVKIRYGHKAVPAVIRKPRKARPASQGGLRGGHKNYKIIFNRSQRAVTPGQSVVFYRGKELVGGGVIRD